MSEQICDSCKSAYRSTLDVPPRGNICRVCIVEMLSGMSRDSSPDAFYGGILMVADSIRKSNREREAAKNIGNFPANPDWYRRKRERERNDRLMMGGDWSKLT